MTMTMFISKSFTTKYSNIYLGFCWMTRENKLRLFTGHVTEPYNYCPFLDLELMISVFFVILNLNKKG